MADTDLHTDFHLMTYKFHFMSGRTLVVVCGFGHKVKSGYHWNQ